MEPLAQMLEALADSLRAWESAIARLERLEAAVETLDKLAHKHAPIAAVPTSPKDEWDNFTGPTSPLPPGWETPPVVEGKPAEPPTPDPAQPASDQGEATPVARRRQHGGPAGPAIPQERVRDFVRTLDGWFRSGVVARHFGIGISTARAYCKALAERGTLEAKGVNAGTRYRFVKPQGDGHARPRQEPVEDEAVRKFGKTPLPARGMAVEGTGKRQRWSNNDDVNRVVASALERGWTIREGGGDYVMWHPHHVGSVRVHKTPSDSMAYRVIERRLKAVEGT